MNVASLLAQSAQRFPDKPALVFHGRPVTYAQLDDALNRAAAALSSSGVARGDRVGLLLGNVPEFVYALYGAFRGGAVAVPLNVMLTAEEVGYILSDAGARAVVCEMAYLPTVLSARDGLGELKSIVVVAGPPVPPGTTSFDEALSHPAGPPPVEPEESDLAIIQYTSGTTANPKGAMLTHRNLLGNLDQIEAVSLMKVTPEDVVLVVLPMFHIYALNVVLGTALRAGATCVLVERFDPAETLELVREHRVTVLPGAPPMFASWLAAPDVPNDAFGPVRLAVSGAAPLPGEVLEGFQRRFDVTIWEGYGLTEAGPAVTSNAGGLRAVPGSIGIPLPGVEVRLIDEAGEEVEEGDPGEVVVRGPNVFAGYWEKEEDSKAAFLSEGWLRTGDVAVRAEDGYLHLVDRKKDLVIVSGFNVYPKEVEEILERHPAVAEAAVIGIPDQRTGEAVKALVVLRAGKEATPQELQDFARRSLARFKVPRIVDIVEWLPHHATGKLLRRALRGEEILGGDAGPAGTS